MAAERRTTWPPFLFLAIAIASMVLLVPANARADAAAAEAIFQAGKQAMEAGRYDEACSKFEASHQAEPSVGAVLNLALCREKQGRSATAWAKYKEAATLAGQFGQIEREEGAQKRAAALEPTLSRLSITVTQRIAGLVVKRNGTVVPPASYGLAIPVDPGKYIISAFAPGHRSFKELVTVGLKKDSKTVVVPELTEGTDVDVDDPAGPGKSSDTRKLAGFSVMGAGGVALVLGALFGLSAIEQKDDLDAKCGADYTLACDAPDLAAAAVEADKLEDTANVSTAMFVLGGVALAAGAVLVITAPDSNDSTDAGDPPEIEARLVPTLGGLMLIGRF